LLHITFNTPFCQHVFIMLFEKRHTFTHFLYIMPFFQSKNT